MITDLPKEDDFKSSGTDYLNLAWSTLISLLRQLKEAQDVDKEYYEEESEEVKTPLVLDDEYWKKAQRPLSTALSLIQQGTEFLLKGHIAKVSPYLLISGDPSGYPRKSDKGDVRFSEFKTIDAQDLIRVYNTVSVNHLPPDFQQRFENLRSKRNTIMHTVDPKLFIDQKDLFIHILEICHCLIDPPESWIKIRRKFIQDEPQSVLLLLLEREEDRQDDRDAYQMNLEIDLVIKLVLEPSETLKYFKFEKKQRRYICPVCYSRAFGEAYAQAGLEDYIPRLAQLLVPNDPTNNSLYCIVCDESSSVVREDCSVEDCKGNVIDYELCGICLTCGGSH